MIVIKEPHALKVSFVTVVLKARHHHVSWGSCVAVFVYALVCFVSTSGWASPSCWSLLVSVSAGLWHCALSTPTHKCTHAHRYTHTHTGTHTVHTHTGIHAHTHEHIHRAHAHRYTHTHEYIHSAHAHRCTRTHTWAHTQCTHTGAHTHTGTYTVHIHRCTRTHMGTYTMHTHRCTHTHGHIHSAHRCTHTHTGTYTVHTHRRTRRHGYTQFPPSSPSLVFPPHILSLSPPFLLFTLPFLLLQMSTFNVLLDPPLLNLRKPFFWTLRNIYSRNHTRNNQEKKSANNEKGQHW